MGGSALTMTTPPPAVARILETSLYVGDLARSVAFYRRLFGFPVFFEDARMAALGVPGAVVLLLFRRGGSTQPSVIPGGIIPPHDGSGVLHVCFAIAVEALLAWSERLAGEGIAVESRVTWPRGGVSLYFRDPDGHSLELATPGVWPNDGGPGLAARPVDILVVGDVMTDVIVHPDGPTVHGTDRPARVRMSAGGSGANQAAWLGALGARVALAARVGTEDATSQAAALRRHGVVPHLAVDPVRPTGSLVALIDGHGERSFLTDRGANLALSREDLPDALLDGLLLLHVSGYALFTPGPRAATLALCAEARARGLPWTVDAASSGFLAECGAAAFLGWTEGADTLFANADEAALLAGSADAVEQLRMLSTHYRCVVLKRGRGGAMGVMDRAEPCAVPATHVIATDTTGAGDAFLAGFLHARLRGLELTECLEAGVAQGALAVTLPGGRPPDRLG
jgi:sugar/nucleoside kinase (ribokinase family)/catechol 2,3-dioxygenase-like lactoylglutathione lyase family enzyme